MRQALPPLTTDAPEGGATAAEGLPLVTVLVATPLLITAHTLVKSWWFSGWVDLLLWLPHALACLWLLRFLPELRLRAWWLPALFLALYLIGFLHAGARGTLLWVTVIAEGVRWATLALFALLMIHRVGLRHCLAAFAVGVLFWVWANLGASWAGVINHSDSAAFDLQTPIRGPNPLAESLGLPLQHRLLPIGTGLFSMAVPLGMGLVVALALAVEAGTRIAAWLRLGLAGPVMLIATLAGVIGCALALIYLDRDAPTALAVLLLPVAVLVWRWGLLSRIGLAVVALPLAVPVLLVAMPGLAPGFTVSNRRPLWSDAVATMSDVPTTLVAGWGFQGDRVLAAAGHPFVSPDGNIHPPHNMPLQALVDGGLPWFAVCHLVAGWLLWVWWRRARESAGAARLLAVGVATGVLGWWCNGFSVETLGPNYQIPTFFVMLAMAATVVVPRSDARKGFPSAGSPDHGEPPAAQEHVSQ